MQPEVSRLDVFFEELKSLSVHSNDRDYSYQKHIIPIKVLKSRNVSKKLVNFMDVKSAKIVALIFEKNDTLYLDETGVVLQRCDRETKHSAHTFNSKIQSLQSCPKILSRKESDFL